MSLQSSFDVLSRIIDEHESRGRAVRRVEATSRDGGAALHVTMDVPIPLCGGAGDGLAADHSPEATLTDDGRVRVEFPSVLALPSTTAAAISASERAVRVTDDGLRATVEVTIDPTDGGTESGAPEDGRLAGNSAGTEAATTGAAADTDRAVDPHHRGAGSSAEPAAHPEAVRDEALPPYEDTDYLQWLYDSCDTFEEMSRTIAMDVSSETVRRYLIDAGIHEPTSYRSATGDERAHGDPSTAAADDAAEPESEPAEASSTRSPPGTDHAGEPSLDDQIVTDGLGLPEDLRIEDVVDAVVDSTTVYDVQRHLDLERRRTRELLEHLNLLDLVMHRISEGPKREVTYEQVATRIRQCSATGA